MQNQYSYKQSNNQINNQINEQKKHNEYMRKINNLNTIIKNDSYLASWIRNTIILFTLGISISTFAKSKYKQSISLAIYCTAIILGVITLYNYYVISDKIYNNNYELPDPTYHYSIYTVVTMLLILAVYFVIKFTRVYSLI